MRSKKRPVSNGVRVNAYNVMARCVEEGVEIGWNRAHKHEDLPSWDLIRERIAQEVLNRICEDFTFNEGE